MTQTSEPDTNDALTAKLERTPLARVEAIAAQYFCIAGRASVLSSERDETFLIQATHAPDDGLDRLSLDLAIGNLASRLVCRHRWQARQQ